MLRIIDNPLPLIRLESLQLKLECHINVDLINVNKARRPP
jgi:hypothetical protein